MDEFDQKVEKLIRDDRRLTLDELHEMYPEVGRTVPYETITDRLKFRKLCTCWTSKMLTDNHKANRVRLTSVFLDRYEKERESFIDSL